MTVSQKVQIVTFDQGPSLSDVTVKSLLTDSTVTGGTADSCPEIATDAGVYVAEFVNADAAALIPAGAYRLRAVIGGAPLNRYVTLKGVDGEVAYSTDVPPASSSGISVANVTKSLDDTGPITFSWPVTGAVITAQVSIDNGLYQAAHGTFAFLRTDEPGIHYYTLSFDADDRPTAEGTARYKLIDGSGIRGYINLSMNVSSGGGGGGGTESDLMVSTTIATLASQTSFTLTAGSADNDAYNRQLVVITDSATSTQKARGIVSDYVGSSKTVTLTSAPAFTIAAGDSISIIAIGSDVSSTQVLSAVSSAIVSAGITTTVTGMPTFLRVGDARTVANGGAIPVRLYNVDDDSLLFGLGENLFEDATITFSLRRTGTDSVEGVEDAAIPCTWVEDGADGYVQIAYEADALDDCDAMDKLKEKDCHRWGIKFQWGTDDPITPIYGNISVLRKIVTTQS